jgi:hypothetical protein
MPAIQFLPWKTTEYSGHPSRRSYTLVSFITLLFENIPQTALATSFCLSQGGLSKVSSIVLLSFAFSIMAIIYNLLSKGVTAFAGEDEGDASEGTSRRSGSRRDPGQSNNARVVPVEENNAATVEGTAADGGGLAVEAFGGREVNTAAAAASAAVLTDVDPSGSETVSRSPTVPSRVR